MRALPHTAERRPGGTIHACSAQDETLSSADAYLLTEFANEPVGQLVASRYRIRSLLGRGGMGHVWLAEDEVMHRPVALKQFVLSGAGSEAIRAEAYARALREARAAARVEHTGAVRIYDLVTDEGSPWIVMEVLRGRTLDKALRAEGPLPADQVTRIGLRLVDVLHVAHRAGLVHCDLKPSNVHLCDGGRVVLADFGIASVAGADGSAPTGELAGSPAYLAPELIRHGEIGPACDVFSLGSTLFTAVEGKPPFDRDSLFDTLLAVVLEAPAPLVRAGRLGPVLEGLLAKEPEGRLTLDEAYAALKAVERDL